MEVICLEEKAFYALIDEVVDRIQKEKPSGELQKWISGEDALRLLNISSSTLQSLRNLGKIRYSKPSKKIILYDRNSINDYLERHAQETF